MVAKLSSGLWADHGNIWLLVIISQLHLQSLLYLDLKTKYFCRKMTICVLAPSWKKIFLESLCSKKISDRVLLKWLWKSCECVAVAKTTWVWFLMIIPVGGLNNFLKDRPVFEHNIRGGSNDSRDDPRGDSSKLHHHPTTQLLYINDLPFSSSSWQSSAVY